MKFIKEILSQLTSGADTSFAFQFYIAEGYGGYFQNVKGVERLSSDETVLLFKTGALVVGGENLVVTKYCDGDMLIEGNIIRVEKIRG